MNSPRNKVYINGMGAFLPGEPVGNDDMESYLGMINGKPSALRRRILKENGIRQRHYAMDQSQKSLYRNSEMAALACKNALDHAGADLQDIEVLACATTQSDLLVPGFGSMVHGELKNPSCEVASLAGVCASGLSALKYCLQEVQSGEAKLAVACASEFPSRLFKASRYEDQQAVDAKGRLSFDTEFLRWMLSDGAGAAVLSSQPNPTGISLEINWIKIRSHADKHDVCMYAGANTTDLEARGAESWLDRPSFAVAASEGMLNLKQDVRRLDTIVNVGLEMFLDLIEQGLVNPDTIDWMVCHYSSEKFRTQINDGLGKCGISPDKWRWFSNLSTKGNTGAASIYIMLDELLREAPLVEGQTILCMVPESSRFTAGYMMLTVRGTRDSQRLHDQQQEPVVALAEESEVDTGAGASELIRKLTKVWLEFDRELAGVPLVKRIERGNFTVEDYKSLLLNWRQQVVDGGRWIARAASNIDNDHDELRSLFVTHAKEEHLDFRMLDANYVALGGQLAEIQSRGQNIGSEALSAFVFQRASAPNPFDLLGTMFIIEGLGKFRAYHWGKEIKRQLGLKDDAVSFFLYHGKNDENHFERLAKAIDLIQPSPAMIARIVKTARITARLYRLQLEELDRY